LQSLVAYIGQETDGGYARRLTVDDDSDDPLAIERELAWIMARIPSLAVFKTEEWTSRAVRACIDELMVYNSIQPYVKHLSSVELA
ncbi:hypothetical protein EV174_006984, partial [Coemansia sp. RSA 2320]